MIADVERWPNWNHGIKYASLEGEVIKGSKFKKMEGLISNYYSNLPRSESTWISRMDWEGLWVLQQYISANSNLKNVKP